MRLLFCGLALVCAGVVTSRAQGPAAWATIKGQVLLPAAAAIPVRAPLPANAAGCPKGPILDESVIVNPKTRGVKNVVVWLRPNNQNPKATLGPNEIHPADANRKPQDVVIDQPCCMFEPHLVVARVGDTVVVKNSAPIVHNFFWVSENCGNFNPNIPANGQFRFPMPLARETTPIPFSCTIHPWMKGYLRVFDHPYYAVTDDNGAFEIANAPVGNYRLVYWHEKVGYKGGKDGRFGDPVAIVAGPGAAMVLKPTDFDLTK
jgi:plastocyanin